MILLKDAYIYDCRTAEDYLDSLGMDKFDIEAMQTYLSEKYEEHSVDYWKQEAKEWEQDSINQFEKRNGLICDIQELADNLASGKGGTKIQYANKLKELCEYWY